MDFRLDEDQVLLAQGVRDYFAGTHGPQVLRRLDQSQGRDTAVWQGLVDMGLPGLLVPESHGGMGLGLVEGALIATECGRACLAEPLVDTALIAVPWLIARGRTGDLAAIAQGTCTVDLPHAINPWVADGAGTVIESVDPLRRLTLAPVGTTDDPLLLDLGALMSAAQLLGLADAMLVQAVDYARLRTQFGQPIGAFQAVKHSLATCAVAIEFARPVVWRAAAAMRDALASASLHVSHAKISATDAAMLAAETAIQTHGAMGYTYEVDLHFWMKRTWALGGAWGDRSFHVNRVGQAVLDGDHPIGPDATFA
jgi:alkylation response protein AidB-like acyl-CoA dehydrogenase